MKKRDMILAAAVMLAAFAWALLYQKGIKNQGSVIEITVDGKLYGSYSLSEDKEIPVESVYGRNLVMIKDGRAFVTEADCPDHVCEDMEPVSGRGEVICCLPHRMFLKVTGEGEDGLDAVAY